MALLTAAEAKEALTGLSGTGSDTVLDKLIAAVGVAIAEHLGYPRKDATTDASCETLTYTFYSGGNNGRVEIEGRKLILPARPVTSVTSVHDDTDQGYSSSYLVASTDYTTDAVDGVIRLLPTATHGGWSAGEYAVKVIAVCGFTTVPTNIKQAARWCVRHWWEINGRGLSTQISAEGVSVTPPDIAIPKQAAKLLEGYRLATGWVA
jgi:hypothetical protein